MIEFISLVAEEFCCQYPSWVRAALVLQIPMELFANDNQIEGQCSLCDCDDIDDRTWLLFNRQAWKPISQCFKSVGEL